MSRDSRIYTVLECMTFFSLGSPGLRSDVKWSRQDTGEQRGKRLESHCPPPCHGIAPQSDEIICVNVYGLTHARDSLKDERGFLVSAGQVELGDLRELQPRERERERLAQDHSLHIRRGMELFPPGLDRPSFASKEAEGNVQA